MGALSFAFIDPEEAARWMDDYASTMAEECVPVGETVNPNVAVVSTMMVCDDEEEALRRGLEGGNFFGYSLAHYYVFGEHRPAATDVWAEFTDKREERGYSPEIEIALQQERLGAKLAAGEEVAGLRGAVGTPDQVRAFLRRYEEAGVDQVIFVLQAGKNRHEHIMESIERFGTRHRTRVRRAPRRPGRRQGQALRSDHRSGARAQGRPPAAHPRPAMPSDYVMKAIPEADGRPGRERDGPADARDDRGRDGDR